MLRKENPSKKHVSSTTCKFLCISVTKERRNKPQVFGVLPCMLFVPLQLLREPDKHKQEKGSSFIFMRTAKPQRPRALSEELQEVPWWRFEA